MPTSSRFAVAVHVLTLMAWANNEPLKSEQIARSVNTNPVVIRRILCALARAQIVVSQTGAAGGSRLARRPGQITLLDVYRAVEAGGSIFALHRQPPNRRCPIGMNIETVLVDILEEIESAVGRALSKITLENVLRSVNSCAGNKRKG
jgi:Rrf2 family protein